MSAKEMFEELGYKFISYGDDEIINYQKEIYQNTIYEDIIFNLKNKDYLLLRFENIVRLGIMKKEYNCVIVDMKLNKAIQQQIKELGW